MVKVEEGESVTFHCLSSKRIPVWKSDVSPTLVIEAYNYTVLVVLSNMAGYYYCRGVTDNGRKFVARGKLIVTGNL